MTEMIKKIESWKKMTDAELEQCDKSFLCEIIRYLENKREEKVRQIEKKFRKKINHAIHVSDEKATNFKKKKVKEVAVELEKAGCPVDKIEGLLVKEFDGLVSRSIITEALQSRNVK